MLPKSNRIKKKKDFEEIFKKGLNFKNSLLVLKILKNSMDFSRFAFVVSLKVSKKAVLRNKLRRRLSAIARKNADKIEKGFDLVFIALPGAEKKELEEIKEAVENLLLKAKIWHG